MGIAKGKELCALLKPNSIVTDVECRMPAYLYIDGPILIYCANMEKFKEDPNNQFVVLLNKIKTILTRASDFFRIEKTIIYFDGKYPMEKKATQDKRAAQKRTMYIDPNALKLRIINNLSSIVLPQKYLNETIPVTCIQLENGEAELQMYLGRDKTHCSVLYTKDTDIYAIAYQHVPLTPMDQVFLCMDHKSCGDGKQRTYSFYDMSQFYYEHLPRNIFRFLAALCGTDYTLSYISPTMIAAIIKSDNSLDKNIILQLESQMYTYQGIANALKYFTSIFVNTRSIKYTNNFKDYLKEYTQNCGNISNMQTIDIERVLWYLNYCTNGM